MTPQIPDTLMTPKEVAAVFAVDPKTVTRWAKSGLLSHIRTPGGHRRYRKSLVDKLSEEIGATKHPSHEH